MFVVYHEWRPGDGYTSTPTTLAKALRAVCAYRRLGYLAHIRSFVGWSTEYSQ